MFFEHHVPKNYHFFAQLVQKWGPHGTHPKEKNNLFIEITKLDHKLSKTFYFIKLSYVFLANDVL